MFSCLHIKHATESEQFFVFLVFTFISLLHATKFKLFHYYLVILPYYCFLFSCFSIFSLINPVSDFLGVWTQIWLKSLWRWRLQIATIIMWGVSVVAVFFKNISYYTYIMVCNIYLVVYFFSSQLAFFTTREVKALEELTW